MNKSELINAVAEKAALSKKDSEAAVAAALDAISAALAEGDEVRLVGFGRRRRLRFPPPRCPPSSPARPSRTRWPSKNLYS